MCTRYRWNGRHWNKIKNKKHEEQHAVDYLVNSFNEHPNEITSDLGPLTNIAKAIQKILQL